MDLFSAGKKIEIVRSIKHTLSLPSKNFFVKNDNSVRLCYIKKTGRRPEIKYINLSSIEEVAIFLKKHGVIKFYSVNGNVITMYRMQMITDLRSSKTSDGSFDMRAKPVEYTWSELTISGDDVLHYGAHKEYEDVGGIMGFRKRSRNSKQNHAA